MAIKARNNPLNGHSHEKADPLWRSSACLLIVLNNRTEKFAQTVHGPFVQASYR